MKTLTGIIFLFAITVFTACEGPMGPQGPPGENGESFLGSVFEIQDDFTSENKYSLYFKFPETITVYESDVVLVYILWDLAEGNDGETLDVWRLLPQTVVLGEDVLQYNYDHTFADVQIFLEGTIDFNTLLPADTDDQVFRIVVLPADFAKNKALDISDFNMMMKSLNFNPNAVEKIDLTEKIEG